MVSFTSREIILFYASNLQFVKIMVVFTLVKLPGHNKVLCNVEYVIVIPTQKNNWKSFVQQYNLMVHSTYLIVLYKFFKNIGHALSIIKEYETLKNKVSHNETFHYWKKKNTIQSNLLVIYK